MKITEVFQEIRGGRRWRIVGTSTWQTLGELTVQDFVSDAELELEPVYHDLGFSIDYVNRNVDLFLQNEDGDALHVQYKECETIFPIKKYQYLVGRIVIEGFQGYQIRNLLTKEDYEKIIA